MQLIFIELMTHIWVLDLIDDIKMANDILTVIRRFPC